MRIRYSHVFDSEKKAMLAIQESLNHGIEAGRFNWIPLLSESLGQKRKARKFALNPRCVVNFPCHQMSDMNDLGVIAAILRRVA